MRSKIRPGRSLAAPRRTYGSGRGDQCNEDGGGGGGGGGDDGGGGGGWWLAVAVVVDNDSQKVNLRHQHCAGTTFATGVHARNDKHCSITRIAASHVQAESQPTIKNAAHEDTTHGDAKHGDAKHTEAKHRDATGNQKA
jgi:hypothetical protein